MFNASKMFQVAVLFAGCALVFGTTQVRGEDEIAYKQNGGGGLGEALGGTPEGDDDGTLHKVDPYAVNQDEVNKIIKNGGGSNVATGSCHNDNIKEAKYQDQDKQKKYDQTTKDTPESMDDDIVNQWLNQNKDMANLTPEEEAIYDRWLAKQGKKVAAQNSSDEAKANQAKAFKAYDDFCNRHPGYLALLARASMGEKSKMTAEEKAILDEHDRLFHEWIVAMDDTKRAEDYKNEINAPTQSDLQTN